MRLVLRVSSGRSFRESHDLDISALPLVLGRGDENRIKLPFDSVSRRHCVLEWSSDGTVLQVRDLDSSEGTFVNGERVTVAPVFSGDMLRIGSVVVRVELLTPLDIRAARSAVQVTRRLNKLEVHGMCELCGAGVDTADLVAGAQLAEGRVLCDACVGQLEGLPAIGALRLLRRVGMGSVAEVHKAIDTRTRKVVALKSVSFSQSPSAEAMTRLQREIEVGKRVRHPNIVGIHEAMSDGLSFSISMDYVDGENLESKVLRDGPLSLAQTARLATELGSALDHVHSLSIVHRDVKPGNVLLEKQGRFVLTDMGLARCIARSGIDGLTMSGQGMGTPHFMPPEQFIDAKNAMPANDIYGLAASLYFALSAHAPFEEKKKLRELYHAVEHSDPQPVTTWRADLPDEAAQAIAAGLARKPESRPASAGELGDWFARGINAPS